MLGNCGKRRLIVTENWIKWCRKWQNSLQVAWKVNISLLVITFVQTFGDFVMVKALNIENYSGQICCK